LLANLIREFLSLFRNRGGNKRFLFYEGGKLSNKTLQIANPGGMTLRLNPGPGAASHCRHGNMYRRANAS
jgi:hypothetical protein